MNTEFRNKENPDKTHMSIDHCFDSMTIDAEKSKSSANAKTKLSKYDVAKLVEETHTANLKTPQHDVQELVNQLLLHDRLHIHYEKKRIKNTC